MVGKIYSVDKLIELACYVELMQCTCEHTNLYISSQYISHSLLAVKFRAMPTYYYAIVKFYHRKRMRANDPNIAFIL